MSLVRDKFVVLVGAAGMAAMLAGCPDGDDAPDARIPGEFDANTGPMVDAAPPDAPGPDGPIDPNTLRAGTIAVLDTAVTNNLGQPISGSTVTITYSDLTVDEPAPLPAFGACTVTIFDVAAGDAIRPERDEGAVMISGTTSPITPCGFSMTAGDYLCPITMGQLPMGTAVAPVGGGAATVTMPGVTFMTNLVAGSNAVFAGFTNAGNNTPLGRATPVVNTGGGMDGPTLVVFNPLASAETLAAAGGSYLLLSGVAPTPAARDFLDGDDMVTITKADGAVVPGFTATIKAAGDGFTLSTASTKPHTVPTTAMNFSFDCSGAGGDCGAAPGTGGVLLSGLVVTGRTTDAPVSPMDPTSMPPATSKFATFTCQFINQTSGMVPMDAWAAVLGTNPTRIETRVIRPTADVATHTATRVLVGHALVGFTDVP